MRNLYEYPRVYWVVILGYWFGTIQLPSGTIVSAEEREVKGGGMTPSDKGEKEKLTFSSASPCH